MLNDIVAQADISLQLISTIPPDPIIPLIIAQAQRT